LNLTEAKNNVAGIAILLVAFTVSGVLASYLYVAAVRLISATYVSIAGVFVFAGMLVIVLHLLRKYFKITTNFGVFVVALAGLAVIYYSAWVFHIVFKTTGVNPLTRIPTFLSYSFSLAFGESGIVYYARFLNEAGVVLGDNVYSGAILGVFWFLEFLVIFAAPIIAAFMFDGVFLPEYNRWGTPRHLPYSFARFNEEDRERIRAGDIDAIIDKPLAVSSDFSTVSVCYVDKKPTEYITLFKSSLARSGKTRHNSPVRAIRLTREEIEKMESKLARIYADYNEEDYYGN